MSDARKKPCCICRRWFRPDPRIGLRQRACRNPDCQVARRRKKQKQWRERNPDYFIARRILDRGKADRAPEPLRLRRPLSELPWDIAQFEFGVKGIGWPDERWLRPSPDRVTAPEAGRPRRARLRVAPSKTTVVVRGDVVGFGVAPGARRHTTARPAGW